MGNTINPFSWRLKSIIYWNDIAYTKSFNYSHLYNTNALLYKIINTLFVNYQLMPNYFYSFIRLIRTFNKNVLYISLISKQSILDDGEYDSDFREIPLSNLSSIRRAPVMTEVTSSNADNYNNFENNYWNEVVDVLLNKNSSSIEEGANMCILNNEHILSFIVPIIIKIKLNNVGSSIFSFKYYSNSFKNIKISFIHKKKNNIHLINRVIKKGSFIENVDKQINYSQKLLKRREKAGSLSRYYKILKSLNVLDGNYKKFTGNYWVGLIKFLNNRLFIPYYSRLSSSLFKFNLFNFNKNTYDYYKIKTFLNISKNYSSSISLENDEDTFNYYKEKHDEEFDNIKKNRPHMVRDYFKSGNYIVLDLIFIIYFKILLMYNYKEYFASILTRYSDNSSWQIKFNVDICAYHTPINSYQLVKTLIIYLLRDYGPKYLMKELIKYINRKHFRVNSYISGFKLLLLGRFSRKDRAFYSCKNLGAIQSSSKFSQIDYSTGTVILPFGLCSIHIWINFTTDLHPISRKLNNIKKFLWSLQYIRNQYTWEGTPIRSYLNFK